MQIEYQNSPNIYKLFLKKHFLHSLLSRLPIYGILSLLFAYSGESKDITFSSFWIKSLLLFVLITVILHVIPYIYSFIKLKQQFKKQSNLLDNIIFEVQDDGILIKNKQRESKYLWHSISRIEANPEFFVITLVDKNNYVIPADAFSSNADRANFIGSIQQKAKSIPVKYQHEYTGKPPYLLGLVSFIPLIGIIIGLIFISQGILKYKDKWFTLIALAGLIFNIYFYTGFLPEIIKPDIFEVNLKEDAIKNMSELVKQIEFYKLENGTYPDDLDQLRKVYKNVSILDPLQLENNNKRKRFYYKKIGNQYELFSKGKDAKAYTFDDILPEVSKKSISRLGLKVYTIKDKE